MMGRKRSICWQKAALSVHDAEGKQTAMDSLEKLYEEKADAESAAQEEADSQAQQTVAAAEMVAAGDKACLEKIMLERKFIIRWQLPSMVK